MRGAPTGRGAAKRVDVSYSGGNSVVVTLDGQGVGQGVEPLACLVPLFDRVDTDGCTWTIDGEFIVISMEKCQARPWASLTLA